MRPPCCWLSCSALSWCGIPGSAEMWFQTKWYSGDGRIYNCSNLISAGYCIDFPEFDANRPFSTSYRLSHVPKVFGRDPAIYLKFRCDFGSNDEIRKRVTASFRVAQLDASGTVIRSSEFPMAAAVWGESRYLCAAYRLGQESSAVLARCNLRPQGLLRSRRSPAANETALLQPRQLCILLIV